MSEALVYDNLSAFYGASQILHGVSMRVEAAQVVCLLGLNGMGKTTTLRATMGLVDRIEGSITLNGTRLEGRTCNRAHRGITLVPEDRKVFPTLTVRENLQVAVRAAPGGGFRLDDILTLFPRLGERLEQKAGTLSGGEQQMLVVGRALVANPSYVMLDEPTEGLSPSYVGAIKEGIDAARDRGIGVLLVEQSLALALAVGDHFYIIENGQIIRSIDRATAVAAPGQLEAMLTVE